MKKFMDENFMMNNETAIKLYNKAAKDMPVYDYHCHISPKQIYEDKRFKNITEVWLYGDHYKWRAMRSNGIDEKYITGNSSDYEKFRAWAETMPYSIGNPLYHWTHMELKKYFGIDKELNEKTCDEIWEKANEMIKGDDFTVRNLILRSNVKVICTTDDPVDDLRYHKGIKEDKTFAVKVCPTFRPDKGVEIGRETFIPWIEKLSGVCGRKIDDIDKYLECMSERIEFFHETGCRISDHALDSVPYEPADKGEIDRIFKKAVTGGKLEFIEIEKFRTYMMIYLGNEYAKRGWVMQIHIAAMRNNNTRMYKMLGADTGFDSINDDIVAYPLSRLMDALDSKGLLPKTILYTLNPKDNYVLGTMLGNFQEGGIPGKIQFGSGWWFNDHRDGMREQMKTLANVGLISRFVGMLTDSRSFLSYTRHDYFRRILCNLIGEWVENGEYPCDMEYLKQIISDISYNNAKNYFDIEV